MARSILGIIGIGLAVGLVVGTGCKQTGVGDPCVPEQEFQTTFNGFDPKEVNVESKSYQCQTRLCLVNHFRGRVSCPYGQDQNGKAPPGAANPCAVPGGDPKAPGDQIVGNPSDPKTLATVEAQCFDRSADNTVYCSCRCQNIDGRTDDGANYCTCPDGFTCSQLVSSIGAGDTGLTGGYCVRQKTQFDPNNFCGTNCSATARNCGTQQL